MAHLIDVKPLAIDGLVKSFGRARAVDSISLEVGAGTIVGLVGPNGSGKTTTLRAIVGLVEPDAGRILVNGFEQGTRPARGSIGYVPDEPAGLDELTVAEFLALHRALYRARPDTSVRAARLLGAFGLGARLPAALGSLSHGLRRQVSIVAALALGAPLAVVDEATAALDPEAVIVLREALRAVASRGSGVLVATQDLNFAAAVCDRLALLSRGRLVAEGTLASLQSLFGAVSLEEIFLAALGRHAHLDDLRRSLEAL